MSYKKLGVTCVKVLVFDEADQMLAACCVVLYWMSITKLISGKLRVFRICYILFLQVLLFSATFNETVTKFISRVVKDSNKLLVQKEELSLEAVKQYKVYCPDELTKIHVNLFVNYDLPIKHEPSHGKRELPEPDYELYLHRCGRTGRFGGKGAVINLLCLDWDHLLMENIEKYYNIQVPEGKICEEAFENALRAAGLL
ncbi:DEAD-box ATP-dependent RNA helicase 38-like [Pyrus ussuriensis x Pyrus communis]|uniref:DEAD-box ATP-dependent RNA helicase 38-like n=1 Tax=Pyrus ussuriensis x Pyrus communis TaxID=2448454 RepID=A0A5N5HSY5_9ROSA|nr:DEAD-box ATP-dependent RNA helicase 38-like [Pyrus ussuriensis x Pyrus communis]